MPSKDLVQFLRQDYQLNLKQINNVATQDRLRKGIAQSNFEDMRAVWTRYEEKSNLLNAPSPLRDSVERLSNYVATGN